MMLIHVHARLYFFVQVCNHLKMNMMRIWKKEGISCAGTFSPCVPVQRGDCLDKAGRGEHVGWFSTGAGAHRDGRTSVLGDFQNAAAQGPKHPDLILKLAML